MAPRKSFDVTRRTLALTAPLAAGAAWMGASAARGLAWGGLTEPLGSLDAGGRWLNTPALDEEALRGKVVLVNFWTYSCINSLRPLPYVRAWAGKYRDRGLVVVGVHAPEFRFERDLANVEQAVADLDVTWPVVLDNDHRIWNGFGNSAWPGFHFVDADGRVRGQILGEGDYDRSERLLQKLLAEAQGRSVADPIAPVAGLGPQAAPAWEDLKSPETYVGYARTTRFAAETQLRADVAQAYVAPTRLPLNRWSLSGPWKAGAEFAALAGGSGSISYRFHARDLNLVLAPPPEGGPARFRVRVDGADPGAHHGFDTDAQGWGRLDAPRMYQLVRQAGPVADRTFEIEIYGKGARAYAFTFG